jgi:hypothetical protein
MDDWRAEAFDKGFQLGAKIERRAVLEVTAGALLEVLGKDAGDGVIDLGAAGRWAKLHGRWVQAEYTGTAGTIAAKVPEDLGDLDDHRCHICGLPGGH